MSAAVRSIDPARLMARAWPSDVLAASGGVWVIAAGKASRAMATCAVDALGERLAGGILIEPDSANRAPDLKVGPTVATEHVVGPAAEHVVGPTFRSGVGHIVGPTFRSGVTDGMGISLELFRTGHPLPTDASIAAGRRALDIARALQRDGTLLVLLSGGASALMACPAGDLTLDDKRDTGARLLAGGADIHAINTVRKHLSAVKGGRLAAAATAAVITLAISDVVGDDPSVIGSGPTVPDDTTYADAMAVLDAYGGRAAYRRAVVEHLRQGDHGQLPETPKSGDRRLARATYRLIGSRRDAMEGAAAAARDRGYAVLVQEEPVVGEARETARRLAADLARRSDVSGRPLCVVTSGETTVHVDGPGRGGRNQEFALAAAGVLSELRAPLMCASIGTDGVDGPTDAAGAIGDHTTWSRAAQLGLDPEAALKRHDSYPFFDALGDVIRTGPTGTNVGDLQVWLMTASSV